MEGQSRRIRSSDGRSLRVTEGGDPEGAPVILHHGTPLSGELYKPHLDWARSHAVRIVSYDRPGYGGSDPRPGRSTADAASDVAAIVDALRIERFAVWGHSGGGSHALACAALLPDRVSAAACSGAPAPYDADKLDWFAGMGSGNVTEYRAALAGRDSLERFLRPQWLAVQRKDPELPPELLSLLSPEDLELLSGEFGAYLGSATESGLAQGMTGWVDDDLETVRPWGFDLRAIRVPTSIWHGKRDLFVPFAHAVWLSDLIPGSELRLWEEESHLTLFRHRGPEILSWLIARSADPARSGPAQKGPPKVF